MKTFKVKGFVLREMPQSEADKVLVLLLRGDGRLRINARGARKPTSKFLSATQLFTYSEFVVVQKNGFFVCSQADTIEHFFELRTDYEALKTAAVVASMAEKITPWGISEYTSQDVTGLVLYCMKALCKGVLGDIVLSAFALKLLQLEGYAPDLCGSGLVGDTLSAAEYVLSSDIPKMFSFNATSTVLENLKYYADTQLRIHMDIYF